MNRLLIDCSGVDFSRQPTGIPRVVLKYLDTGYEWGAKNNVQVIPVICTSNGVLLVRPPPGRSPPESLTLLADQSVKIMPSLMDTLVPRVLGYLGRVAASLVTLLAAIVPLPILEESAAGLDATTRKSVASLKVKIKSKADHFITLKEGQGDVLFCPAYWHDVDPSVFKRIRSTGAKVVILVHDILPVTHAQFYQAPWRYEFRNSVMMLSTYADAIFCVSRFTLDCVVEFLSRQAVDIPAADVAYNGFDPLVPQAGQRLIEAKSTIMSRSAGVSVIRERRPYLMVGSVEPKKGHLPTLYCFESMWTAGLDRDLVIVGRKGWMDREISNALEHSAYYGDKLHWYSDFDDFDLVDAYIHSHALIFSSVAEGFGIPLIEAASYGRPLVVRETAIAREIVGDAALYFTDAGSLVSRIIELEDSDGYDGACRRASSVRWPTWNACSQSLFERLNALAGPSPTKSGEYRILTLQDEIASVLSLIRPWRATDHRKRRIGGPNDGGYVMLDAIDDIEVCYSLGVGPDVTWDMAMARRGALVFQYDHTVDAPPEDNENFRFHRVGITHDETADPTMREIGTLLIENGHAALDRMVLKMDIEGHEWDCLAALPATATARFRQIVVEFHGMRLLTIPSFRERARTVFAKLSLTHQVVHVHGNNFGEYAVIEGMPIPDVIELTLARRSEFSFAVSDEVFPTYLDAPCNGAVPDFMLGLFRFT